MVIGYSPEVRSVLFKLLASEKDGGQAFYYAKTSP
jgi:hypothetical protein